MRLEAVTICIEYSDFLSFISKNKNQFDAWHIITTPNDKATQKICVQEGLHCHIVNFYGETGELFNPISGKSEGINYGLNCCSSESWVVLLDADILLPIDFRDCLENFSLSKLRLYGVQGRRIIKTYEELSQVRFEEYWHKDLDISKSILGFINIFHNSGPRNRYLTGTLPPDHDDLRFARQYLPELRQKLPISVLHLGETTVNWTGRKAANFSINPQANEIYKRHEDQLQNEANVLVTYGSVKKIIPAENQFVLDLAPLPIRKDGRLLQKISLELLKYQPLKVFFITEVTNNLLFDFVNFCFFNNLKISWVSGYGYSRAWYTESTVAIQTHFGFPSEIWTSGVWRLRPKPYCSRYYSGKILVLQCLRFEKFRETILCAALAKQNGWNVVMAGAAMISPIGYWIASRLDCKLIENDTDSSIEHLILEDLIPSSDSKVEYWSLDVDKFDFINAISNIDIKQNGRLQICSTDGEIIAKRFTNTLLPHSLPDIILNDDPHVKTELWKKAALTSRIPIELPKSTSITLQGSNISIITFLKTHVFINGVINLTSVSPRLARYLCCLLPSSEILQNSAKKLGVDKQIESIGQEWEASISTHLHFCCPISFGPWVDFDGKIEIIDTENILVADLYRKDLTKFQISKQFKVSSSGFLDFDSDLL